MCNYLVAQDFLLKFIFNMRIVAIHHLSCRFNTVSNPEVNSSFVLSIDSN